MPVRTLIADDEPLARDRLRCLLGAEPDITIAGECSNGIDTVAFVERGQVDLVLLDIQMPEMNGFDVIRTLAAKHLPAVIFVTAYDAYALRAFEVHALDYLLKPVEAGRLTAALNRVRDDHRRHQRDQELQCRVAALLVELAMRRAPRDQILVKSDGEMTFLAPEDIDWVESAGNYVTLHMKGKTKLLRETLQAIEKKLAPYKFARISRSVVVNTARIQALRSAQYGDYHVQLRDATELTLSRGYRDAFFGSVERL